MLQAHSGKVQSRNWQPDAVQGKSKQTSNHTKTSDSWCVRSGWHTVGQKSLTGEKSSDSKCLCRLFLFPLGIPANLHLCQLDVADDIGVWKTKTGKGWFISCSGQEMVHQYAHKSSIKTELSGTYDIVKWQKGKVILKLPCGNIFFRNCEKTCFCFHVF